MASSSRASSATPSPPPSFDEDLAAPDDGKVTARQVVLSASALWLCYYVLASVRWAVVGPAETDLGIWLELLGRRGLVTLAGVTVTAMVWPILRRFDDRPMGMRIGLALVIMLPAAVLLAAINQKAFAPLVDHWDKTWQAKIQQDKTQRSDSAAQSMGGNVLIDVAPPPPPPSPTVPPAPSASSPPTPPTPPSSGVRIERHENGVTEITTGDVHIISRKAMKQPHGQAADSSSLQTMHDDQQLFWQELTDIALGRYFLLIAWAALYLALGNAQQRRAAEWREAEYRRAAKAAELRSLRYQVNPHFLFNTLNSLSALVMVGRAEEAERMIQTISSFYRHSLTTDPTADVPLVDEIALQRHYLAIEGVRFPERLRVEFDVPANVEQACVPGMILQPLVENSIKYAVSATTRPVTIRIRAQAVGDLLVLSVADDGPGLPPGDHRTAGGTGIGLANVRSRLAARFGAQARVESGPLPAGGYASVLTLPILTNAGSPHNG